MEAVVQAFDEVLRRIEEYEEEIALQITESAKKRDWHKVQEQTDYVKKIELFANRVCALKEDWESMLIRDGSRREAGQQDGFEDIPIEERTRWERQGDKIRVFTYTNQSQYTHVLPIWLFREISLTVIEFARKNGTVKVADVFNEKRDIITSKSDYHKSPRTPIYITFKILLKEKLVEQYEGKRGLYSITSEDALLQFLRQFE